MNNIPENILQQVADEAFAQSPSSPLSCVQNGTNWKRQPNIRRAIIQHAMTNPALAPFMAGAEPTPPAQAEPAAQVPLGPEDVPPGSVFRSNDQPDISFWTVSQVWERGFYLRGECVDWRLAMERMEINTSIPDTGRWDKDAWRPCSKPGKEVEK